MRTTLEVAADQVRGQTTIDLAWVGELFELNLGVAPGLDVVSVGPAESVESMHLSEAGSPTDRGAARKQTRILSIRLSRAARDRNKVTLKVDFESGDRGAWILQAGTALIRTGNAAQRVLRPFSRPRPGS